MRGSYKLFKIAGIEIRIHFTWLFIFVFFTWTLAQSYFPAGYPGWATGTYWLIGAVTSLLLFASVLVHEFAHSLVARAKGLPVGSITLFILGGVSNLEEEPKKPWTEFIMAIAGPATSLLLALIFWLITLAPGLAKSTNPAAAIVVFLAYINLVLGIFNLLPGFPMDGGRVLRSIIWGSTKNLGKATNIAATVGQVFGWLLIGYGVYYIIAGVIVNGIWAALLGWFLISAAGSSRRDVSLRERLERVKVRNLMNMASPAISPETTVQDMVTGIFAKRHDRAVPVCRDNQLIGIATITDVKKVPQEKWAETPVKDIMSGGSLQTVTPDDDLYTAMKLIAKNEINQVIIKDGSRCAGMLTRADILRYFQMSQELGLPPKSGDGRPA